MTADAYEPRFPVATADGVMGQAMEVSVATEACADGEAIVAGAAT